MIEEKNPLHREYGLFSNINYVLQGMRKYSKILMWMLPIGFVISPIQRYLWSFITKFVIDIVTNNSGVKNLLFVIGTFSVISLLVFLCQTFYNNKVWVQCIVVRMKIILKKNLIFLLLEL